MASVVYLLCASLMISSFPAAVGFHLPLRNRAPVGWTRPSSSTCEKPMARGGLFPVRHQKQASSTARRALAGALVAVDTFYQSFPYVAAFLTCGIKASAADAVAQSRQSKGGQEEEDSIEESTSSALTAKNPFELPRNIAFLLYGAVYQGVTQEYVYNHLYPVWFGSGTAPLTVLSKVAFDLLVQTPLFTLPIAYLIKSIIFQYSPKEALTRYIDDIQHHGLLKKYFYLWGPVQCLTFSVVPEHLRVSFIACVSFFWLIILSSISTRTRHDDLEEEEMCSLVDGTTCSIDG